MKCQILIDGFKIGWFFEDKVLKIDNQINLQLINSNLIISFHWSNQLSFDKIEHIIL